MRAPAVSRRLRAGVVAAGLVLAAVAAGCGEDVPTKAQFTSEIGRITGGRVDSTLASCVYDELSDDEPELLRRAVSTPKLSKTEDERLTKVLATCVLAEEDGGVSGDGGSSS
jgi:hypothetical protein